jgi:hypothetical protein
MQTNKVVSWSTYGASSNSSHPETAIGLNASPSGQEYPNAVIHFLPCADSELPKPFFSNNGVSLAIFYPIRAFVGIIGMLEAGFDVSYFFDDGADGPTAGLEFSRTWSL